MTKAEAKKAGLNLAKLINDFMEGCDLTAEQEQMLDGVSVFFATYRPSESVQEDVTVTADAMKSADTAQIRKYQDMAGDGEVKITSEGYYTKQQLVALTEAAKRGYKVHGYKTKKQLLG